MKVKRVVIIGGGLSGLALAWLLAKKGINATVLEASARLGGRIQTINGTFNTPLELGATWFSDVHTNLISLMDELGLGRYTQYSKGVSLFQTKSFEPPQKFFVPEAENSSYRIIGGTQALIDALSHKLPIKSIYFDAVVSTISETDDGVVVGLSDGREFRGDIAILCLPPQLVALKITFNPSLPEKVSQLLPKVQTWMAGAIKFVLEYDTAFWRKAGYSGMLYSHAGIIMEMYDHTNFEESKFGFTGFLNGSSAAYSQEVRKEYVLRQLTELLGEKASSPTTYGDKVWADEFILAENQVIIRPHQNNGHPLLQESYIGDKVYFAGTEASTEFSGYMEGAVIAAKSIAKQLVATA